MVWWKAGCESREETTLGGIRGQEPAAMRPHAGAVGADSWLG